MLAGYLMFCGWVGEGRLGRGEAEVNLGCPFLSIIHALCFEAESHYAVKFMWRPKVDIRNLPQSLFLLYFEAGYLT